jgi:dCTP deaminase
VRLLIDKELVGLIQTGLIEDFKNPPANWYDKNSLVQPASIDLHIGKIYLPEIKKNKRGSIENPKTNYHTLQPGETVLVEVDEMLNVPPDHAGFGFPPSSTAVKGILMTNPGHIDPGFRGHLTFTLINMGKDPFTIKCDDIIFTTLWVRLSSSVEKDYYSRSAVVPGVKEENVDVLSKDFLNVDKRSKEIANKRIALASTIALLISTLGLGVQYYFSSHGAIKNEVTELSKKVAVIESKMEESKSGNFNSLEREIYDVQSRLERIEKKQKESR